MPPNNPRVEFHSIGRNTIAAIQLCMDLYVEIALAAAIRRDALWHG